MHLKSLRLTNFRNYVRLDGSYQRGVTLLHGQNAQGKTNFLEAVYYLATASASHARNDRQLIHFDAAEDILPFARVDAQIERADGTQRVSVTISIQSGRLQKNIELNGVKKQVQEYIGEINVVLFLPEDIDLIATGPQLRRRYLDTIISQIEPRYYRALQSYEEVLSQRNAQLRALSERGIRDAGDLLDFWDEKLVAEGAYIVLSRQRVVARLDELAGRIHPDLTGYLEFLHFAYQPRLDLGYSASHQLSLDMESNLLREGSFLTLPEVEQRFREALANARNEELGRGMTVIGPHRDDLRFLVNDVDMTLYGSRGQQRTSALTLKLCEVALIQEKRGEPPILLLDDVMSELDESRRTYMSKVLEQFPQVFITTADLANIPALLIEKAQILEVQQGQHDEKEASLG